MTNFDEVFVLSRTGLQPLRFTGRLFAVSRGEDFLPERYDGAKRWHDISIYEADGVRRRYVVYVEYHTHWRGEPPSSTAYVADSLKGAAEFLARYNPAADMLGMPPPAPPPKRSPDITAEQEQQLRRDIALREERRQYVISSLVMRFQNQVSKLLSNYPEMEVGIDDVTDPTKHPRYTDLKEFFVCAFEEDEERFGTSAAIVAAAERAAYYALVSPDLAVEGALESERAQVRAQSAPAAQHSLHTPEM